MGVIGQVTKPGKHVVIERGAGQVRLCGPLIDPQQLRDLGEVALAHKLADGISAVQQPAVGAVDKRKRGLPREDALETW